MNQAERERSIREYLDGRETPEGKALFDQWADRLFADEQFMNSLSPAQIERFEEEIWSGIKQRIGLTASAGDQVSQPVVANESGRVMRFQPIIRYAVAASISLLLVAAFVIWKFAAHESLLPNGVFNSEVAYRTVTVPTGERLVVTLPDSTKVTLNAESTLRYPEKLTGATRHVFLQGEGFFDVTPKPNQPFIVTSSTLNTTVKGTSFNVKAYPDEATAEVTVVTGKVEVSATHGNVKPVLLLPTDRVTYAPSQIAFTKQTVVSPSDATAWRQGTLVFRRTPMHDIVRQLQRQYGVRIHLSKASMENCTIVAEFGRASLEEVLTVLCSSIDATYQLNGKEVIITGNGC